MNHIFICCRTGKEIWLPVLQVLNIKDNCDQTRMEESLLHWSEKPKFLNPHPTFVSWGIWLQHFPSLFHDSVVVQETMSNSHKLYKVHVSFISIYFWYKPPSLYNVVKWNGSTEFGIVSIFNSANPFHHEIELYDFAIEKWMNKILTNTLQSIVSSPRYLLISNAAHKNLAGPCINIYGMPKPPSYAPLKVPSCVLSVEIWK